MLDADLAQLYEVETGALVRAVKHNPDHFPPHFMFQLTKEEWDVALRRQTGISKPQGRGGRRYPPYAFTEQGVAMLSSVLRSKRAIQVNIAIMDTFVRLRRMLQSSASSPELARKLAGLDRAVLRHDVELRVVFKVLRQLMAPPEKPERRIGFKPEKPKK